MAGACGGHSNIAKATETRLEGVGLGWVGLEGVGRTAVGGLRGVDEVRWDFVGA